MTESNSARQFLIDRLKETRSGDTLNECLQRVKAIEDSETNLSRLQNLFVEARQMRRGNGFVVTNTILHSNGRDQIFEMGYGSNGMTWFTIKSK